MGLRADTTHVKYFSRLDPPQEYEVSIMILLGQTPQGGEEWLNVSFRD